MKLDLIKMAPSLMEQDAQAAPVDQAQSGHAEGVPTLSISFQTAASASAISCGTVPDANPPEQQANDTISETNASPDKTWSLAKCKKRRDELLRAYENALKSGKVKRTQSALWAYLRSYAVRVDAARRVIAELKAKGRRVTDDPFEVARQINWGQPIKEPARLWFKEKKTKGTYRPIYDFGVVRRAACEVLRPILKAHLKPQPFQHDVGGKRQGMQSAIRAIKEAIKGGLLWTRQIDIANHFGSFSIKKLHTLLPLSKEVIDHVVAARHIPVVPYGDSPLWTASLIRQARRGIPQGSPIASLVAQIVTSKLAWSHTDNVSMANFADNFCVLGNSVSDVNSATDALGVAIATLPGGKFLPKKEAAAHLSEGIEFLGHYLKLVGGELVVAPTEANMKKYDKRMLEYDTRLCKLPPGASKHIPKDVAGVWNFAGDMWVFAKSWVGAFSECTTLEGMLDAVKSIVTEHLSTAGLQFSDIEGYENPDAEWDGDLYES